mgnify:CR=1 FL=1
MGLEERDRMDKYEAIENIEAIIEDIELGVLDEEATLELLEDIKEWLEEEGL